jgi:hypothetical protein
MSAVRTSPGDSSLDVARLASIAADIESLLERVFRSVDEEIRHYPTPIPRCDAQFNALYEQRTRLAAELSRFSALATAIEESPESAARTIDSFLHSPPCSDDAAERQLRSRLQAQWREIRRRDQGA